MNIVWSPQALDDLVSLHSYIAEENSSAAERVIARILHNVESLLPDNPRTGRPGRVPGTRELVIPRTPFIVPYRIEGREVHILRVYHGARRWPDRF